MTLILDYNPFTIQWLLCTWVFTPSFDVVEFVFIILSHPILILEYKLFSLES